MRHCAIFGAVREQGLWWVALRPMSMFLVPREVLPWRFHQVCCNIVVVLGKLGSSIFGRTFAGSAADVPCFSGAGEISTEAEVRHD